jgi:virulence-associated protein VapD
MKLADDTLMVMLTGRRIVLFNTCRKNIRKYELEMNTIIIQVVLLKFLK